jgi:hypothetical protein
MAEMIDLDELLNGNPTWEQVVEFWRDDGDFCGEEYLVSAIEKWLMTEEQRELMFKNRLTVEKMLNGRYYETVSPMVHDIFKLWNDKLGFDRFGG